MHGRSRVRLKDNCPFVSDPTGRGGDHHSARIRLDRPQELGVW